MRQQLTFDNFGFASALEKNKLVLSIEAVVIFLVLFCQTK